MKNEIEFKGQTFDWIMDWTKISDQWKRSLYNKKEIFISIIKNDSKFFKPEPTSTNISSCCLNN